MGFSGGGAGAIPASVLNSASQNSPELFVDAWGAKGDSATDDTIPINNALVAASAIGAAGGAPCRLVMTPGKVYAVNRLIPQSYVDVVAYGAGIKRVAGAVNSPAFYTSIDQGVGAPVTRFALRGISMVGTGAEAGNQGLISLQRATYVAIEDCFVSGVAAGPIGIYDSQVVYVLRNRLINCCQANGNNAINLIDSDQGVLTPLKYLWIKDNYIVGCPTLCIDCGISAVPNRTDPIVDAHILNNVCINAVGSGGWPIALERSNTVNVGGFDIAGNLCVQQGTGNYAIALSSTSNDPLAMYGVKIRGNTLISNGRGILASASRMLISGNEFESATDDVYLDGHGTAVLNHIAVVGNVGKLGTGKMVNNPFPGGIDYATLSVKGNTREGGVAVAVPASGTAVTAIGNDRAYYVTAGASTCTMTLQDGKAIVIPASQMGTVVVPAGQTVTPTYANAPTWIVEGD